MAVAPADIKRRPLPSARPTVEIFSRQRLRRQRRLSPGYVALFLSISGSKYIYKRRGPLIFVRTPLYFPVGEEILVRDECRRAVN